MDRNNVSRFQSAASVYIKKELRKIAEDLQVNIEKIVEEKLLEVHKKNVAASFAARSNEGKAIEAYNKEQKEFENNINGRKEKDEIGYEEYRHKKKVRLRRKTAYYHHTGLLLRSMYTVTENHTVKIKLLPNVYKNGKTVKQIYHYLVEGTEGSTNKYVGIPGKGYMTNYPTPKHDFEIHTKLQMQGFLDSLVSDIKNGKIFK